ncbi:MAG: hypothetical protein NC112_05955 [Oxalobacter formigenes]|nr:hypothetical protein [Oxalobacter formigenes]
MEAPIVAFLPVMISETGCHTGLRSSASDGADIISNNEMKINVILRMTGVFVDNVLLQLNGERKIYKNRCSWYWKMIIKKYRPEDGRELAELFYDTVVNAHDYTK